jgi:DNA-binding transcriptional ArsR family regulator
VSQTSKRGRRADARKAGETLDPRVVKAIAHPLRHRILTLLSNRVASPSEMSTELDEPLGNVAYHVRTLLDLGCIELVRTAPRRGALEHYYRAIIRPIFSEDDWAQLPIQTRNALIDQTLRSIVSDVSDAAAAGGFERDDVHASRTVLDLDETGYGELAGLINDLVDRALEIHAESVARRAKSKDGAEPLATELAIIHFERRGTPSDDGGSKRRRRS